MRNKRNLITGILAGAVLTAISLWAAVPMQTAPGSSAGKSSAQNLSSADRKFMTKAAEDGLAEVQMGQLAEQKGATPEVKNFGRELVTDHSKANSQLQQVAGSLGVTLPTQPTAHQKAAYDKLSKMSGAKFDSAFVNGQIKDHHRDIAAFQNEANHGSNPEVKNFAAQTIPVLQKHLETARKIAAGHTGAVTPTE